MYKRKLEKGSASNRGKQIKTATTSTSGDLWKHVFHDASAAFKENKFKESAALFTRALSLNPGHTTLLDCRAASYEKLGQLDLALQDAASIIRTTPTEARGYLRAGKILSLQQKHKQAVNIYSRALTRVDSKDKRYQQIVDMKKIAEKKIAAVPSRDFMTVLPYDVISLILSKLSFDRRIQCTGVSRTWRTFTLGWSGMWRDLSFGNRKVSHATIKRYLSYAQGRHVRRFAISDANQSMMKKVLQLLIDENCQYIETLDFFRCELPKTVLFRMLRLVGKHVTTLRVDESDLDLATIISQVIPGCPRLTHLSMIGVEEGAIDDARQQGSSSEAVKLTHLRMSIDNSTHTNWFLSRCTNLVLLDLYTRAVMFRDVVEVINSLPSLCELHYTHSANFTTKTQWSSVVNTEYPITGKLEKFGIYGDLSFTDNILEFLVNKHYQSLKQLVIADCRSLNDSLARLAMAPGLPCLQVLNINACISLEEWNLHTILSSCPTIQDLSMSWNMGVTDSVLNDLKEVTKKLTRLDISHCNNVTGVGLQNVVKAHRSSLEKIVLSNCQRIGPDAIRWAIDVLGRRVVECKYST